jgi:hypothetical protein
MLGIFSIILGIVIYVVFDLGSEVGLQLIRFVYPMGLSLVLGRLVLYLRWEKKHEMRLIVDGFI